MPRPMRRRATADAVGAPAGGDAGFSMMEVVVSLAILAFVLAATAGFFASSLHKTSQQSQRQAAVTLAQQALESTRGIPATKLLSGRTQTAVQALIATPGAVDLSQDHTSDGNYDPTATSSSVAAIPVSQVVRVANQDYTIRIFIDLCYLDTATHSVCGPNLTTGGTLYRVTADVQWTPGGNQTCSGGQCEYVASTLRDPSGDPVFNNNPNYQQGPPTAPTLSTVSPSQIQDGTTATLILQGANFSSQATVSVDGSAGSITSVTWSNSSTMTATWASASGASAVGSHTLTVTNPGGGTSSLPVYLTASTPTITSVAPSSISTNRSTTVVLTGTGFDSGLTVSVDGTGGSVTSTTYNSSTQVTVVIAASTTSGSHTLTLKNPDTGSATTSITYATGAVSITSMSPSALTANVPTSVTLTGSGFQTGAAVSVDGTGGTVSGVSVVSSTQITLTLKPGTTAGSHTLTVTNTDSGTATTSYTVSAAPVSISSISPASVAKKSTGKSITINGSGFQSGGALTVSGGSITSSVTITSTKLTFTYSAPNGAGTVTFTFTNPDGGTATINLSVT